MSTDGRPTPRTATDLLVRTEKRLSALERRDGAVGTIVSIIGPGQNSHAALIGDWNQPLASNNGYYWSRVGALHAPDGVRIWTGSVVARTDNSGMQQVWNTDDLNDVRYFMRTFTDDGTGQGRTFSEWRNFATPTGFIELPNFGDTVNDLLAEMAADIDSAAVSLSFYEQDSPPVPGVAGVPAVLEIGSVWVDTNDNRHTYSWNGTTWVSVESTLFASIDAELALQQAAIEAAATAASDAMDFAVTLTKVYRQNAAPSNPDADGRALVADDVWFDQDDANKMYTWSGSAWVLLGISTETYAADAATAAQAAAIAAAAIDASTKASAAQSAAIAAAAADATTKAANAQAAAIAVANTKSVVFRQSGTPTSLAAGDIWFDTGHDNAIYRAFAAGVNTIGSSAWVLTQIGLTAIADDSITSAKIVANTIQTTDLVATAIDGMTVTGATLQTVVTAARGIKINSTGLTAYNGSGTATLSIVGATGAITMLGDLTSGSTVTGAVVTGGTMQSEATAARGIKITSASLIAYNGSGVAQFTINASTGAVTLAGPLTGAGTITGPTFQTSASANTGIKISSSGMFGYNGTSAQFSLNATTGTLTLVGPVISAAGIAGSTITGGTIQSESTPSQGVKMDSAGIVFYNATADPVLTFTSATGALTLVGSISTVAVNSGVITGGTVQTVVTAARGIKITSAGMIGYADGSGADPAGTTMFSLLASTGVLTLAGGVLTGGSVTGTTITAAATGVIQTEATAARGIKINSAGMVLYDGGGNPTVTLDAGTGAATFKGAITTGSTIDGAALTIGTNIRLNPTEGLYVAQPGGGRIQFPADGTDAIVQANVIANSLTVSNGGQMYGTTTLSGAIKTANGVPDPTVAPTLANTYPPKPSLGVGGGAFANQGAVEDATGTYLIMNKLLVSNVSTSITWVNKATGACTSTTLTDAGGILYSQTQAITRIGTTLYGLWRDAAAGFKVWTQTITGVGTLTTPATSGVVLALSAPISNPTIGNDGTNLLLCWNTGTVNLTIQPLNSTTFATTGTVKNLTSGAFSNGGLFFVGIGNYDYGASRTLVGYLIGGTSRVDSWTSANVYTITEVWQPDPAMRPGGLIWDGTNFWSIERTTANTPIVTKYASGRTVDSTIYGSQTWYDGNATGGTHETGRSPETAAFTWKARAHLTVYGQPPPQMLLSTQDAANLIRFYVGSAAGATKLQTGQPLQGNTSFQYETVSFAGAAPPAPGAGTFGSIGSAGLIYSENYVAGTSGWQLKGDGTYEINGPPWLRPGAAGGPVWAAGWEDNGPTAEPAAMQKNGTVIKVQGLVWRISGTGVVIMTLPVGCRPGKTLYRPALMSNSWAYTSVSPNGDVSVAAAGAAIVNSAVGVGLAIEFDLAHP